MAVGIVLLDLFLFQLLPITQNTSRFFFALHFLLCLTALGAGLCLWFADEKYEKHPAPLMKGTGEWVHQCHVFTPPVDSPKARLQFRLEHSLGTMWVDGVLLEDVTDNQKGK